MRSPLNKLGLTKMIMIIMLIYHDSAAHNVSPTDTGNSSLLQELQIDIVPNSECTWPSDYINDEHLCVMDHEQKLGGMCHVSEENWFKQWDTCYC